MSARRVLSSKRLYSYLNASIGFKEAARTAGYMPKNNPTTKATENANRTASPATTADI